MKHIKRCCAESDSSCSSLFSRLPDELVLDILNKINDLKTLCNCKLVSKRFSPIVVQVDTLSVSIPSSAPHRHELCATRSIWGFTCLKSLCIQLPFNNPSLSKWKIKFVNSFDSFVFLSPNSIYDNTTGNTKTNVLLNESGLQNEEAEEADEEEEDAGLHSRKYNAALRCLFEVNYRMMIVGQAVEFPLLEYVSITDWGKSGTVCFNSGQKISQVRDWICSEGGDERRFNPLENCNRISRCYIPLLTLPVSGYVMKGVTMILVERDDLSDDSFISVDDFDLEQDKEEAAYSEAMMEIFKNHKDSIERVP